MGEQQIYQGLLTGLLQFIAKKKDLKTVPIPVNGAMSQCSWSSGTTLRTWHVRELDLLEEKDLLAEGR